MMQAKGNLDDKTDENLKLISEQIRRITQVTHDMMDFARVRPAAKNEIDINKTIETSLRLATFDKSFKKLTIEQIIDENLPKINADQDQLQQVFLNLFLNARDAMPDGGKLSIKTFCVNKEIVVEVADTGTGINRQDTKKIFDPFFTTKSAGKGTGLGLAVCYGIITAHGGKIEATENEPNGTSFLIFLPQNEKAAE